MIRIKATKILIICLTLAIVEIANVFKNANKYFLQQNVAKAMESTQDTVLGFAPTEQKIKNEIRFKDNTVVYVCLGNFFNNVLLEPNEALTGFKQEDLVSYKDLKYFLSKGECLTEPTLHKFAEFALNLEKDNSGLIKIFIENYNNLLPILQKDISKIDDNEYKKIEVVYNEIPNLRVELKKYIKDIDSYISDYNISTEYLFSASVINKYLKCWRRTLHVLLKAISIKLLNITVCRRIKELTKLVTESEYYKAVKSLDIKGMEIDCYTKEKLFKCISNLKNCLYIITYQYENACVKDKQLYERFINFSKKFSKNLYRINQNLNLKYQTTKFCCSMLQNNVDFSFPYFCSTMSLPNEGSVEFTFNDKKIDNVAKHFSENSFMLEDCKSEYILNYINTTFAMMQYVMSEEFNKLIRCVFLESNQFNEIDDDFYKLYFKPIFDAIVDKVIEYNRARVVDDINYSLRCYFSNLSDIVRFFLNYFKLNKLDGYILNNDVEHRDLKLEDEEVEKYSKRFVNDFELFCYFFNDVDVRKKLINNLESNLENNLNLDERRNILQHIISKLRKLNENGYSKYKDIANKYVAYIENLLKSIPKKIISQDEIEIKKTIEVMDEFEKFISSADYVVGGDISNKISFFENFLIENIKAIFGSEFK